MSPVCSIKQLRGLEIQKVSGKTSRTEDGDVYNFHNSKIQNLRRSNLLNLINKNTILLDLGSCPGGWSQVAKKIIKKGKILAVDIKEMEKIDNVEFIKADIDNKDIFKKIEGHLNATKGAFSLQDKNVTENFEDDKLYKKATLKNKEIQIETISN